jgi:cytoskeletal protein RodZ
MPKPRNPEPPSPPPPLPEGGLAALPLPQRLGRALSEARSRAGLSLAQVSQVTKIHTRFLQALEEGRLQEIPSPTHVRAFALAAMRACYGDEKQVQQLWNEMTAPAVPEAAVEDKKAEPPLQEAAAPAAAVIPKETSQAAPSPSPVPRATEPAKSHSPSKVWAMWAMMAFGVVLVLWVLSLLTRRAPEPPATAAFPAADSSLTLTETGSALPGRERVLRERLRAQGAASALASLTGSGQAGAPLSHRSKAPRAAAGDSAASTVTAARTSLGLRARQACWLVLKVDGQLLEPVALRKGEKRYWDVAKKAVLLAGNIGALRVWWEGGNLGYLGPKGERANGLVFEVGKKWHKDSAQALPLPEPLPGASTGTAASGVEPAPEASPEGDADGLGAAN